VYTLHSPYGCVAKGMELNPSNDKLVKRWHACFWEKLLSKLQFRTDGSCTAACIGSLP
jgi:hypothetical protein